MSYINFPFTPAHVRYSNIGILNDFDFHGNGSITIIQFANATDLTITGFSGGTDGQIIVLESVGQGDVFLSHGSTSSTFGNRLFNRVSSIPTPLASNRGSAIYIYDGPSSEWRLNVHEQGAPISYNTVWTASLTPPSLGNGFIESAYYIEGINVTLTLRLVFGTTTDGGNGIWQFYPPPGMLQTGIGGSGTGQLLDASSGANYGTTVTWVLFLILTVDNTIVSDTNPFPWGPNDVLTFRADVEAV